jgi:hypothetical protein
MNQLTITLVTATTALIAGIAGPFVSLLVARRQIRASVISNNRELWIVALRDALAEYLALVMTTILITGKTADDIDAVVLRDADLRHALERALVVRGKILLMIDPNGSRQGTLHQSIEAVHGALVNRELLRLQEWRDRIESILGAGRELLQEEWERIKHGE